MEFDRKERMRKSSQFLNREEAGRKLAEQINSSLVSNDNTIILALPRGGVPVAFEVSRQLNAPMEVIVVRSLGFPGNKDYTVGALAEEGMRVTNEKMIRHVSTNQWKQIVAKEQLELERSVDTYRAGKKLPQLFGKTVVLIDDGLATGAIMLAAAKVVKQHHPERVIVAAPVGARTTCQEILNVVNEVICLRIPDPFHAVDSWYHSFPHPTDDTIVNLLSQARNKFGASFH